MIKKEDLTPSMLFVEPVVNVSPAASTSSHHTISENFISSIGNDEKEDVKEEDVEEPPPSPPSPSISLHPLGEIVDISTEFTVELPSTPSKPTSQHSTDAPRKKRSKMDRDVPLDVSLSKVRKVLSTQYEPGRVTTVQWINEYNHFNCIQSFGYRVVMSFQLFFPNNTVRSNDILDTILEFHVEAKCVGLHYTQSKYVNVYKLTKCLMRMTRMEYLRISKCWLDDDDTSFLFDALHDHPSLRMISFCGPKMNDLQYTHFSDLVEKKSLEVVDIDYNFFG